MDKIFSIVSVGPIVGHHSHKDNIKTTVDLYPNKVVVERVNRYITTDSFSMQHISQVTVLEASEYIELYINRLSICAFTKTDANRANVKKFVELLENIF